MLNPYCARFGHWSGKRLGSFEQTVGPCLRCGIFPWKPRGTWVPMPDHVALMCEMRAKLESQDFSQVSAA